MKKRESSGARGVPYAPIPILIASCTLILVGCDKQCPAGFVRIGASCAASIDDAATRADDSNTNSSVSGNSGAAPTSAGGAADASPSGPTSTARNSQRGSASGGNEADVSGNQSGSSSHPSGTPAGGAGAALSSSASGVGGAAGVSGPASPLCGNNIVESGEICDGNCPSMCTAPSACQVAMLVGTAATCSAMCSLRDIKDCVSGDGCCAPGCKYPEDGDCSKSCGDGVVDPPEVCEASSASKPCPKDCDDKDPCTTDMLSGSAAQCNAICLHVPVTAPMTGDHCCPPGANASNDSDCETKCGDGVVTGNETCDSASSTPCPTNCDDGDRCTTDMVVGSAAQCNAMCAHMGQKAAPERCDYADNDCNGKIDDGVANACGGCQTLSAAPGTPCSAGMGACMASGQYECDGKEAVKCSAVAKSPSKEVCGDNIDNDCNGQKDDCPFGQTCMASGSGMVCSLQPPNGSYKNSCTGCTYDGVTLTCASCDQGNGSRKSSSTSGVCPSGQTIANCSGNLGCRDPQSRVFQGSFYNSCTGCFYDECQLTCDQCEDGNGGHPRATTTNFPCAIGISNCSGMLECRAC